MRIRVFGNQLKSFLVMGNRVICSPPLKKGACKVVLRGGVVGQDGDAREVTTDGAVHFPFGKKRIRQVAGRFGVIGSDRQRFFVMRDRVIDTPSSEQRSAKIVVRFRISRINC